MVSHIQFNFKKLPAGKIEEFIALLTTTGAEGFEEMDNELKAYWAADTFNEASILSVLPENTLYERENIENTNWNEVWESNFSPVVIEDFAAVRAEFHPAIAGVQHEIVITPKMSFGTGHHATTTQMILAMRDIDFNGKKVFDFGTGTGVLAILAARLGATEVLGLDNDDWSIENAQENIARNNVTGVEIRKGDNAAVEGKFDVILANINRHIILENIPAIAERLNPGAVILLSGLLAGDEGLVLEACAKVSLRLDFRRELDNWLCMRLS